MSNSKGRLQELLQHRGLPLPRYHSRSTGSSHFPTVTCTVTVHYGGKELREEVCQRGGKKKDVEKIAAENMLQRIRQENVPVAAHRNGHLLHSSRVSSAPPVSLPPARHASLAVATRSASLSPHRSPSPSATPTPGGRSPVAVLQERVQGMCLSPPKYEERPRSSATAFRCRCVVYNGLRQPVLESQGEGRSKRSAKDAAARDMLQKMDASGNVLPSVMSAAVPDIPEVLDPGLHDDIATHLSPYSPQYHFWDSPGEVR